MRCPACAQPLEQSGRATHAGLHCQSCGHLWRVMGDQVVALNAGNPLLTVTPAPTVTAPAVAPAESGVMTAAKAAPFIEKEIG